MDKIKKLKRQIGRKICVKKNMRKIADNMKSRVILG